MREIDTNILVYADRSETAHHRRAGALLRELAEGPEPWGLPWPCVVEFLRVVSHPRVFHPPTPAPEALESILSLVAFPSVRWLGETARHLEIVGKVLDESGVAGNLVHDAHVVALLVEHGFDEILTTDEDFRRFSAVRAVNPFR
jgi:hypothetical protein